MKKIYKIFKIFEIFLYSIVILCILLFSYYMIKRLIDKDKPSKIFGHYIIEVAKGSGSMYNPSEEYAKISLSPGDLLFVKPLKNEEYELGMTITFFDKDNVITTHQIVKIEDDVIVTKGINKDNSLDDPITYDQILGCVTKVWRGFRGKVNFFTTPIGIILVIGILFGINFGLNLVDKVLKEKLQNENSENKENKIND